MRVAIPLILLLAGCSTVQPPPDVVDVPTPEPVPCVDASQIPEEPPMVGGRFNGDAKHDLQILAPNAQALRQWGRDLRALLEACVIKEADAERPDSDTNEAEAAD